jgi:hypothetical protein
VSRQAGKAGVPERIGRKPDGVTGRASRIYVSKYIVSDSGTLQQLISAYAEYAESQVCLPARQGVFCRKMPNQGSGSSRLSKNDVSSGGGYSPVIRSCLTQMSTGPAILLSTELEIYRRCSAFCHTVYHRPPPPLSPFYPSPSFPVMPSARGSPYHHST